MTAFEHYFNALKKILGREDLYDIWPDFEPEFDEREFAWTTLRGLGEILLLNCGLCDGPSDLRHMECKNCTEKRSQTAKDAYQKATGRPKEKWSTIALCRIHTE
ncbi:MAG: hypothetical protein QXN63_01455 [Candidatus Bathyarchaeia archaeon]